MQPTFKLALLSVAACLALNAEDAAAGVTQHSSVANAVNYCQAFTPGPANTIRNRVVGSENVGPNTMNVACNFHSVNNGALTATNPTSLWMYFSNNSGAPITISCTLMTGWQGSPTAYAVTKSVEVGAGSQAVKFLNWTAVDNPTPGATDLGNRLVGVNCTLPVGAVINDTYVNWNMDNGL